MKISLKQISQGTFTELSEFNAIELGYLYQLNTVRLEEINGIIKKFDLIPTEVLKDIYIDSETAFNQSLSISPGSTTEGMNDKEFRNFILNQLNSFRDIHEKRSQEYGKLIQLLNQQENN